MCWSNQFFLCEYFDPSTKFPDERGKIPIDFKEDVAVNPMGRPRLYVYNACFARSSVRNGLFFTWAFRQGKGVRFFVFILFVYEQKNISLYLYVHSL